MFEDMRNMAVEADVALWLHTAGYSGPSSDYRLYIDEDQHAVIRDCCGASVGTLVGGVPAVRGAADFIEEKYTAYIWTSPCAYNGCGIADKWAGSVRLRTSHWTHTTRGHSYRKDAYMDCIRRVMADEGFDYNAAVERRCGGSMAREEYLYDGAGIQP